MALRRSDVAMLMNSMESARRGFLDAEIRRQQEVEAARRKLLDIPGRAVRVERGVEEPVAVLVMLVIDVDQQRRVNPYQRIALSGAQGRRLEVVLPALHEQAVERRVTGHGHVIVIGLERTSPSRLLLVFSQCNQSFVKRVLLAAADVGRDLRRIPGRQLFAEHQQQLVRSQGGISTPVAVEFRPIT